MDESTRNRVRRFVKLQKGNLATSRFDTSDIVQEVLIQLWRDVDDCELPAEPSNGKLRTLSRGHTAKLLRFHGAQKRASTKDRSSDDEHPSTDDSPSEQLEKEELILAILDRVAQLSDVQQLTLARRLRDDWTFREIGAEVEMPAQKVRRLYLACLQELTREFGTDADAV